MDLPPGIPSPRPSRGEIPLGRCYAITVEVALAIPPGNRRILKGSSACDQVSWFQYGTPKCLGFSVEPSSFLVLVWIQYYPGFSTGGRDMDG